MSENKKKPSLKGYFVSFTVVSIMLVTMLVSIPGGVGNFFPWLQDKAVQVQALFTGADNKLLEKIDSGVSGATTPTSSATASSGGNPSGSGSSAPTGGSAVLEQLERVTVDSGGGAGYVRSDWKHWSSTARSCWNIRETVLERDATKIQYGTEDNNPLDASQAGSACKVLGGEWVDPYTGTVIGDVKKIDIDHVVPLEYAHRHGGATWGSKLKEAYANDTKNLLAVSATENRAKGSKGPGKWMPANKAFHCDYAKKFVGTIVEYKLTVSADDKSVLVKALETCG